MPSPRLDLKLGSLFVIIIGCIIFFGLVYHSITKIRLSDCMYNACLIQALNGQVLGRQAEKHEAYKYAVCCQALLAYMITSGAIVVSLSYM